LHQRVKRIKCKLYPFFIVAEMKKILVFITLFLSLAKAQNTCEIGFIADTLFSEKENSFKTADALVTSVLSNGSQVKFFKTGNQYFLTFIIKDYLYFDKIDDLEIVSGKKSMFQKSIKQYQKDKFTAFFVFEVFKNYINTLKDEGITALVFNGKTSKYNKNDVKEIKKIANCFYETINVTNTKK